jgi:hypothetical protein
MAIPVGTIVIGILELMKLWGQILATTAQQANVSADEAKAAFLDGFNSRIYELRKPIDPVREN